jgi:hypothetical protein
VGDKVQDGESGIRIEYIVCHASRRSDAWSGRRTGPLLLFRLVESWIILYLYKC